MKKIKNFSDFFLAESLIPNGWPSDWKSMPEWKVLEEMGFRDITTKIQAKNQTIMITNPNIRLYPDGIVLQKSGYIRDKAVRSGFIKKFGGKSYSLKMMLDFVIRISSDWISKRTRSEKHGDLTDEQILLLADSIKTEKWRYNPETKMIDVESSVNLVMAKGTLVSTLKFGRVKGDFMCYGLSGINDLGFAPERVDGDFDCRKSSILSLAGSPKIVKGNFDCSFTRIKNLIGCPDEIGGIFTAVTESLTSLEGIEGKDIKGKFRCLYFEIPSFNPETLLKIISGENWDFISNTWNQNKESRIERARELALTILKSEYLDEYFKKNPLDLYFLDGYPEIKRGVLKRIGLRDLSVIGRNLRLGTL